MKLKRFTYSDEVSLSEAFEIRREVFIKEQKVNMEEEFDEFESNSIHYLVIEEGKALGTARWRITDKGVKLERFAVRKEARGSGVGRLLLEEIIREVPQHYQTYIHAQVSVLPFYEKKGFKITGPMFSECNIDHYKMILSRESTAEDLSLRQSIDFVRHFHEAFGLYVGNRPNAAIDEQLIRLRHRLMHEENEEYLQAALEGNLVEVADALGDMLYILNGSIITHGMQDKIGEVYREIQRSNMSKLDEQGRPIYREDGKVMKSNLYFKPDIDSILKTD